MRERYFRGGDLALDMRARAPRTFRDLVGTYGPRSYRYAEMVFGSAGSVTAIRERTPQERIFALRTLRALPLDEVVRRSGLSEPGFEAVLDDFRRRFRDTGTEEGDVMDTVLGYVMQELPPRRDILSRYRTDPGVSRLFDEAIRPGAPAR